jgi:hypothetical protein
LKVSAFFLGHKHTQRDEIRWSISQVREHRKPLISKELYAIEVEIL